MKLVDISFNKKYENDIEQSITDVGGVIPEGERHLPYLDSIIRKQLSSVGVTFLNSEISGSASGAADSASTRDDYAQVMGGYKIVEYHGKLVQESSSVDSVRVDKAGAAEHTYTDAVSASKQYTDQAVSSASSGSATEDYVDEQIIASLSTSKEYTDQAADEVLSSSRDYADSKSADVLSSSKDYADSKSIDTLSSSKEYTDEQISRSLSGSVDKDYVDSKSADVLSSSKDYADSKSVDTLSSSKDYTDEQVSGSLSSSKEYADSKSADTLSSSKDYADSKSVDTLSSSKDYADSKSADTLSSSKDYTDQQISSSLQGLGALTKGENVFVSGSVIVADGTDGKTKVITNADLTTQINAKTKQTAYTQSATAGKYIAGIVQNENGEITVTTESIPDAPTGSGTIGTASSDADAWKNVLHDAALSSGHVLSGNVKTIPAATSESDGYMTTAYATKLEGIQANAEVNQNALSSIVVSGTTISAASKTDSVEFVAGNHITLVPNASNKTITISGSDVSGSVGDSASTWKIPVVAVSGSGHGITGLTQSIPAATTASDGYMTMQQVQELAGKQNTLVSGQNIKTINSQSIIGSGNIEIPVISSSVVKTITVMEESDYDALQQTDPNTLYIITPDS